MYERISRRAGTRTHGINETNAATWHAVGYVRLSREDEASGESVSIASQRILIEDWAISRGNVELLRFYIDDGYSGATFNRPGFEAMMEDARKQQFDTIVVKDLSRFGRSYLDCGNWIERDLPQLGIRLYSIGDNFDSMENYDMNTALLLPMKNLINEMHVAATSEKVRASLSAKRERGEYVANWAPYGYTKDVYDKHRLVVDHAAAEVVRKVFTWRTEGLSASAIARILNLRGVPCPSQHKQESGCAYTTSFSSNKPRWHAKTVLRILRDETYTGVLVQGKTTRLNWRLRRPLPVPFESWHRTAAAHEPIIETSLYEQVQELLQE